MDVFGKDLMNQINSQIGLVSVVLTVIAVMSLLVGGINIMNIMLVTVTERKRNRHPQGARRKRSGNTQSVLGGVRDVEFDGRHIRYAAWRRA